MIYSGLMSLKFSFSPCAYGWREQENRKRKAAAKSCQSLDTVPLQEPSDNDSSLRRQPAATTTSDDSLPQLTAVLQRDIEGKSRFFRDAHQC